MSYTVNSIEQSIKPGMISGYFGSTTTDPPGWVIADGVARTTSNDYNNLVTLSIGSRDVNNKYVPPNFKGAFLRGTGTVTYNSVSYNGPSIKQFQHHSIEKHSHSATQDAHNHGTNAETSSGNTSGKFGLAMINGDNTEGQGQDKNDSEINNEEVYDFTINDSNSIITVASIGDTDTAPFCYGVNWAIKL